MEVKKYDFLRILIMTLAAVGLSLLAIYDISSLPLFSGGTVADVKISDLYNAVGTRNQVSHKADHTTIVSIDGCSRAQIARTLEMISFMEPAVLGLDVFFLREDDEGDAIEEALKGFQSVVLPIDLHHPGSVSFFQDRISGAKEGFVNILSSNATGSVREFQCRSGEASSFAYALAGEPDIKSVSSSLIRFDGTVIPVISAHELSLADEEDIRGKIVLVGATDDPSDMHRTPLGPQTPGVLIHALTAEMMASGKYIQNAPSWLEYLVAIIISALFLWAIIMAKRTKSHAGTLFMRLALLALIFGFFILGCRFYITFGYCFDISFTITMLAMVALVFNIATGISYMRPNWNII